MPIPGGTNNVISWTVPSAEFVLEQNPDLTSTNWAALEQSPVLDYSTVRYQVTVPAGGGPVFYRLASPQRRLLLVRAGDQAIHVVSHKTFVC